MPPPLLTLPAPQANSQTDKPMVMDKKLSMKMPRLGSVAKAWTDVKTPERTRKVPSNESEKARMASMTVQFLKDPRFSVTASE
jgi:hypothetical protein